MKKFIYFALFCHLIINKATSLIDSVQQEIKSHIQNLQHTIKKKINLNNNKDITLYMKILAIINPKLATSPIIINNIIKSNIPSAQHLSKKQKSLIQQTFKSHTHKTKTNLKEIFKYMHSIQQHSTLIKEFESSIKQLENLSLDKEMTILKNENLTEHLAKLNHQLNRPEIYNNLNEYSNLILEKLYALYDSLLLVIMYRAYLKQNDDNVKRKGLEKLKHKSMKFLLTGLLSTYNIIAIQKPNFSDDIMKKIAKYKISQHTQLIINRIAHLIDIIPATERENLLQMLKIQNTILKHALKVATYNYQTKEQLTQEDTKHIIKLLTKLKLNNKLILKIKKQKKSTNVKINEFQLFTISAGIKEISNHPKQNIQGFISNKKKNEIKALKALTQSKIEEQKSLCKSLITHFKKCLPYTSKNREESCITKTEQYFISSSKIATHISCKKRNTLQHNHNHNHNNTNAIHNQRLNEI